MPNLTNGIDVDVFIRTRLQSKRGVANLFADVTEILSVSDGPNPATRNFKLHAIDLMMLAERLADFLRIT